MQKLKIKTHKKKDVLDITETVEKALGKRNSGDSGICNLFILHTTAALTTADLDPGTDLDMLDAFEEIFPSCATGIRIIRRMCRITFCPR